MSLDGFMTAANQRPEKPRGEQLVQWAFGDNPADREVLTGHEDDLAAVAREIIDANRYMTLATADGHGRPWATPVWYAHQGYTDFFWVSRPEARHSCNLASRPELAIVIFDSTVPEGGAQAVYVEALATVLGGAEREEGIAVLSRRSEAQGGDRWGVDDVTGPAPHRLYRARASQHFLLEAHDQRVAVRPG
jgi:nitroimidazol reductase NimA-like FMN-containing flavoprotein (pyridoxamine 5'-phosphate oxidase superfamily)